MMDRQKGTIIFECDDCADTLDTETGDMELANLKRRGAQWSASFTKGEWRHHCPGCKRF